MHEGLNIETITLIDEAGVEHIFEEIDRLEVAGTKYLELMPYYEKAEDIPDEIEITILKLVEKNGEYLCEEIEDEDEFNEVGRLFEARLSENE